MEDKKRKTVFLTIGILSVLLVVAGATYAWWTLTKKQGDTNDVIAACLDLEFESENGTFSLENAWPMSDSEATSSLQGYSFTVKNNCPNEILYEIGFDSLSMNDVTYLDTNYLKVKLDAKKSSIYYKLNDVTDVDRPGARSSKVLGGNTIAGNSTKTHNVKVWVDENAPTSEINTYFKGKIFITAGQNTKTINDRILIASGDISRTLKCDYPSHFDSCETVSGNNVRYEFYDDGTFIISGTGEPMADYYEDDVIYGNPLIFDLYNQALFDSLNLTEVQEELVSEGVVEELSGYLEIFNMCKENPSYMEGCAMVSMFDGPYDPNLWREIMGSDTSDEMINTVTDLLKKVNESDFPKLKYVIVEEGITSISENMFEGLNLESVSLPNSLTEIRHDSFEAITIDGDLIFPAGITDAPSGINDPWHNTPHGNTLEFKGALTGINPNPNAENLTVNLGDIDFATIKFSNASTFKYLSFNLGNKDDDRMVNVYVPESVERVYIGSKTNMVNLKFYGPQRDDVIIPDGINNVSWNAELEG